MVHPSRRSTSPPSSAPRVRPHIPPVPGRSHLKARGRRRLRPMPPGDIHDRRNHRATPPCSGSHRHRSRTRSSAGSRDTTTPSASRTNGEVARSTRRASTSFSVRARTTNRPRLTPPTSPAPDPPTSPQPIRQYAAVVAMKSGDFLGPAPPETPALHAQSSRLCVTSQRSRVSLSWEGSLVYQSAG